MTQPVSIGRGAARDIAQARDWYEAEQGGLGRQFLDEIGAALIRIGRKPLSYPIVHSELRRAFVRRFPYGVFFQVRAERVRIVAVIHQSPDPKVWSERTRRRG